jgi:hypothetical protein
MIVMAGLAAFAELRRAECVRGPGVALAETGPGHPRLPSESLIKNVDARHKAGHDADGLTADYAA